ncbi:oxamate carbamoyltransferase subunit AllG family protein, partial [Yokenella regensburgei]|uniref:oxamate carbamoyltransferase subunit AllG family protein n=1 Tax=Yokenella regensburgei TaxID=158877 RepID=UPI003EDA6CFC
VRPAKEAVPVLAQGRQLLHAGPPIAWQEMTGPMRGACIGAARFEGWASREADAVRLLEQGEVVFIPCHLVGAVGAMGGITSATMPVLVLSDVLHGYEACCNLNE